MALPDPTPNSPEDNESPPFLRLPPELREEIYALVIGGRLIHASVSTWCESEIDRPTPIEEDEVADTDNDDTASADTYIPRRVICTAEPNELAMMHSTAVLDDEPDSPSNDFFSRHWVHGGCSEEIQSPWHLEILRTCKHIHSETRDAPFTFNTFAFSSPQDLEHFANLIGADRFSQIRRILLLSTNHRRPWVAPLCVSIVPALPFGHLHNLDVYVEICALDVMEEGRPCLDEREGQDCMLSGLREFRRFRPQLVRAMVGVSDLTQFSEERKRAETVDLVGWARRIERLMLPHEDADTHDRDLAA